MFSNQSNLISTAMKKADQALKQSNFGYVPPSTGTVSSATETTFLGGDSTIRTNADLTTLPEKANTYVIPTARPPPTMIVTPSSPSKTTVTSPGKPSNLDLKNNDTQFIVFANLIISRFEKVFKTGGKTILVTDEDKNQLSRIVSPEKLVEAVGFRLRSVRENSDDQIHVVLRQCRALGLHRQGNQNPLYASAGTTIYLEQINVQTHMNTTEFESSSDPNGLVRQQIMAELREASNLMAESVTPETAQFWRNHVVSLQTRLRQLSSAPRTPVVTDNRESRGEEFCLSPVDEDDSPRNREGQSVELNPARFGNKHDSLLQRSQSTAKRMGPTIHEKDPESGGLPMVDVVAPANLPEGYTFEAEINNRRFLATVPAGGVRKGRTFSCYMQNTTTKEESKIPVGKWRDGLFDCFKHGVFHPSVLNAFACPLIGLAQVMTRMGLDHKGQPAPEIPATGMQSTFGMIITITSFWVLLNTFVLVGLHYKITEGIAVTAADITSLALVNLCMLFYTVFVAFSTRSEIRKKYTVDEGRCADAQDIVYSSILLPCSIAQMARHTIAYDEVKGHYCTTTGLPAGVDADFTTRAQQGSYRLY